MFKFFLKLLCVTRTRIRILESGSVKKIHQNIKMQTIPDPDEVRIRESYQTKGECLRIRILESGFGIFFFKGLVAGCHSFLFIFIFFITYRRSFNHNTFIRLHLLKPLSISSSLVCSVGKTSLWCRAENRTWACLTASRRAAN